MHAASALLETQRRFLAALYDDGPGPVDAIAGHGLAPEARLRIYRRSCGETQTVALRTTYPGVLALVGEAFFEQTVRGYRREYPSCSGNLQVFGGHFAEYLQALPAARELPYLPDVARLEWLRQASALAADAAALSPGCFAQTLAGLDGPVRIMLHPSVQLLASRYPIMTIWRYAMAPTPERLDLADEGERLALWREDGEVTIATLDAASFACMEALAQGGVLDDAHRVARTLDPAFDLPACIESFVARSLIVALVPCEGHTGGGSCR